MPKLLMIGKVKTKKFIQQYIIPHTIILQTIIITNFTKTLRLNNLINRCGVYIIESNSKRNFDLLTAISNFISWLSDFTDLTSPFWLLDSNPSAQTFPFEILGSAFSVPTSFFCAPMKFITYSQVKYSLFIIIF